jgi:hypothetical protein
MADTPQQGVAAIVRDAAIRASLDAERLAVPDPEIGAPRDGIKPGQWGAPPDMPPDCPVRVLGFGDGDVLYMIDNNGMLTGQDPSGFGQKYVIRLFGDRVRYVYWAWPRFTAKGEVDNFRTEKVYESFCGEASRRIVERGLWSPADRVRGRGAWRSAGGGLIYHAGSYLFADGRRIKSGCEIDGHFYPLRPNLPEPWPTPVSAADNPAIDIGRYLQTWSWGRPKVDPLIVLGFLAAAPMSGALRWRPSAFLVGDKAVGKSTLQNFMKLLLGDGVIKTDDTTEAGIYQRLGMDALPVQIDELEAGADNRRVMAVVSLARIAASGGLRLRGGQDHKGIEFVARSCFFFSAINPPPLNAADWSRLAVLSVHKLDPDKVASAPVLSEQLLADAGRKMLRRLLDNWHQFDGLFDDYRAALQRGGHDSRGCDTYGTFLAAAHVLLGDEGIDALGLPIESFDHWADWLGVKSLPEMGDQDENWRECLSWLLQHRVDAWRGGQHLVIGGVLQDLRSGIDRTLEFDKANALLALTGLKLVPSRSRADPKWQFRGLRLAVPNRGDAVGRIFAGSKWAGGPGGAGVWASALRQGPRSVVLADAGSNLLRINGDVHRCTMIDLDALDQWLDGSPPAPGVSKTGFSGDLTGGEA